MADTTSSSSDDGSASPRSRRNDNRLSADRGVISREAWVAASEGDSESESNSATEDDDDSVPLAQRDEADDSGEETEDEGFHMKQELRDAIGDRSAVRVKTEIVDDMDSSSDESEDDKESEGDEISVKSEHGQAIGNGANGTNSTRRVAHSSEESESDAEEMKSEEEDGRTAVTREYASPTELVGPREDEAHSNEEAMVRSREAGIPTGHLAVVERGEEDEEYDEPEQEVDESDIPTRRDMEAARQVIDRFYQSHLSFTEQSELHKGKRIAGPPIDRSISQADQWKRKYRWPVAMRNVRRRRFIADAEEIATDHEVQLVDRPRAASNVSAAVRKAFAAALAPTARPLMNSAVASFREQHEKREREIRFVERLEEAKDGESVSNAVDATRLRALTRLGGQFTDHVLESLLVKNVLALQGVDASYAQQCWDPLPTSKRPVANWRFVLEHFCRTSTHGVDAMPSSSVPRLRKDTLIRIRDRLKNLYGVAWRPEDSAFFDLVDQQELDPPEASEVYRL